MARVTVEDCLRNVKNRFELVMIAAKRARQLMRGKEPKVEWDNDKATVVALREIAEGYTNFDVQESPEHEALHALQHRIPDPHTHLTVIEQPVSKEEFEADEDENEHPEQGQKLDQEPTPPSTDQE